MGITKNHIHTEHQIELARLFRALGHPARIAIVDNLLKHKNLNCNDLRNYIQLAQSTISGHIKQLHEVGVLAVTVIGSNAYYEIHKIALEQITGYLEEVYKVIDTIKNIHDRLLLYTRPLRYMALKNRLDKT